MSLVEVALKKAQGAKLSSNNDTTVAHRTIEPTTVQRNIAALADEVRSHHLLVDSTVPIHGESLKQPPQRVVQIDKAALRSRDILPPTDMELRVSRQYQQIKRPLVDRVFSKDESLDGPYRHVIMLASALSGEGKTYTSINLALSMALERNVEVLLVDADVAKPHISDLLGLKDEPGLLGLLTDSDMHPDSAIFGTNIPNLSFLPAGKQSETATELLASDRMASLMAQLAPPGSRRIVLLDSPPLLQATESRPLLTYAGQVVLVVRAELTPPKVVEEAIEAVGADKHLSLILNQTTTMPNTGYYGYGSYGQSSSAQ
jgi:protein-tyrosine kinase